MQEELIATPEYISNSVVTTNRSARFIPIKPEIFNEALWNIGHTVWYAELTRLILFVVAGFLGLRCLLNQTDNNATIRAEYTREVLPNRCEWLDKSITSLDLCVGLTLRRAIDGWRSMPHQNHEAPALTPRPDTIRRVLSFTDQY